MGFNGEKWWACPECKDGELHVINAVYAECTNCDAELLRNEVDM